MVWDISGLLRRMGSTANENDEEEEKEEKEEGGELIRVQARITGTLFLFFSCVCSVLFVSSVID